MNIVVYDKSYVVEFPLKISSKGQNVFFPIIQVLDLTLLTSIETFIPQITPVTPTGQPLINSALLATCNLTLITAENVGSKTEKRTADVQTIWNFPMLKLVNVNNQFLTGVGSSNMAVQFNFLKVQWAKSYITIGDSSLINTVDPESFFFNIGYSTVKPPID